MASARSSGVELGHGPLSNASRAAATARSMSAGDPSGVRAYTSSVIGEMTSMVLSVAGATHSLPMKSRSRVSMSALPSGCGDGPIVRV